MTGPISTLQVVAFSPGSDRLDLGGRFPVVIAKAKSVSDLKTSIKDAKKDQLSHITATSLTIWRCKDKQIVFDEDSRALFRQIENLLSPEDENLDALDDRQTLADLLISDQETLLVEIPSYPVEDSSIGRRIERVGEEYQRFLIRTQTKGNFTRRDVELNGIRYAEDANIPRFVRVYEEMLSQKRDQSYEMLRATESWVGEAVSRQYFRYQTTVFNPPQPSTSSTGILAPPISASNRIEWNHFGFVSTVYDARLWSQIRDDSRRLFKEVDANNIFFYPLAHYIFSVSSENIHLDITVRRGREPWPFQLVMKLEDVEVREDQGEDQGEASYYFAYRPRSDLLILNRGFPRLAVEINSTSPGRLQQDRYRLILQGASVVRYANTHLDDFKEDKDFVFMIIYIGDAGEAERDLLYQTTSDDDAVYRKKKYFTLGNEHDHIQFLLELYNFSSTLQNEIETMTGDTKRMVTKLEKDVRQFGLRGFTGKRRSKRPARDDDNNLPGPSKRPSVRPRDDVENLPGPSERPDVRPRDDDENLPGPSKGPSVRPRSSSRGAEPVQASRHADEGIQVPNIISAHGSSWELVSKILSHIHTVYERRNRLLVNSGGIYGFILLSFAIFKELAHDLTRVAVGFVVPSNVASPA